MMTPTRGQHDTEAATVWAAVFPDRASRTTVSLEPGPVLSVRAITSPGNDAWLTRLGRHRTGTVRALAAGAGLTGVVPWPVWAATFPASVHASAAGYRQYIAVVHPWVDTVEPRTADLGWLTALAADPP